MDSSLEKLCLPLSDEAPCGEDLEDTQLLASFDGYRLFGQMSPLPAETNWREIRDQSLEALAQSKDLRLLAHFGAAQLRLSGLIGFAEVLMVAGRWFAEFPQALFPRVDEDAILRKNALNAFADRMAILDALRRQPIVSNPQLGAFSLRHFDIAAGRLAATEADDAPPTEAQLTGVLAAAPPEQIGPLESSLGAAIAVLQQIGDSMRAAHGYESGPDFEPLSELLRQIHKILADELALRSASAAPAGGEAVGEPSGVGAVIGVGSIKSRDDAIRALDAVATFFRKNEPSSPVPMFVERAKRLVAKDFLEVLMDIAPDGLDQARRVGGIRDEE
jgi:type VI secretion system protein ImpA